MLRSLLVGVLALSTASACKGKSDAPAVQPGVAVGTVVEATGEVSATRGAAKRSLAAGQEISGDDVIETGASSNVRIVLAHNNATWELGPNKKQLVSESLAWKQPKQDSPAAKVDEATLAAGRHAERETVTTTNTAPAPQGAMAPAAPITPTTTEEAAAAPAPAPAPGGGAPPPEPDRIAKGGGGGRVADKDSKPVDEGPREVAPSKTATTESAVVGSRAPAPPPPADTADDAEKNMVAPDVVVKKRIAEARSMIGACLKDATPLDIVVVVDKGITSFELPAKASNEMANCFKIVATRIKFPESYTLRVKTSVVK